MIATGLLFWGPSCRCLRSLLGFIGFCELCLYWFVKPEFSEIWVFCGFVVGWAT